MKFNREIKRQIILCTFMLLYTVESAQFFLGKLLRQIISIIKYLINVRLEITVNNYQ